MNISRIALLSFLLCCSSSLHAVPVVWDFVLEDTILNQSYSGSLGYESDQPGTLIPNQVEMFPGFPFPGSYKYDVDFFKLEKQDSNRRWEFTDGLSILVTNEQPVIGLFDRINVVNADDDSLLRLQTSSGPTGPNPTLDSRFLPTITSDFDFFNPFFDDPNIKGRSRSVSSHFVPNSAALVSLDIHSVPEPNVNVSFVFLALIILTRVKWLRRVQQRRF